MQGLLQNRKKLGFTIIELLIVVVVIGILATLTIVGYNGIQQGARDKALISDADGVAAEITRYSTKNGGGLGSAVAWYSGGSANANIKFTPSPGNVIDVVANSIDYCIRVYNPAANKNSINNATTKESTTGSCSLLTPSVAAGGTWNSNLVGWWKFNGSASDATGNGSIGTVTGAVAAVGQNGTAGNSYSFNGVSDIISIPNSPTLSVGATFTLSAWVYPVSLASRVAVFSTRVVNVASAWQLEVGPASGGTNRVAVTGVGTYIWESNNNVIAPNGWYHLVYSRTNNSSPGTLYVNGVALTPLTTTAYTIANNSNPYRIASGTGSAQYFSGRIDDVRMYDRVLTGSEVTALYAAGAQ